MKKLASLLMALVMALTLAVPVVAADGDEEKGSITINGASADTKYKIYRLLDLESYDYDTGAYSYKVNEKWSDFFNAPAAQTYFTIDTQGYATWKIENPSDSVVAAFAQAALTYAKDNGITPEKSSENSGEFSLNGVTGKFIDLPLGYYLVDSSAGALCGLTTTNPDASVNAKNHAPTIDKQVKEDSTGGWGDNNTADIGQDVEFRVTINVHPGAENYVLHDMMSAGLTFKGVTLVEHIDTSEGETHAAIPWSAESQEYDYKVVASTGVEDGCSFEVQFTDAFCNHLESNDKVIVYYHAMLNRNAVIHDATKPDESVNPNETWLEYGENHYTSHDKTSTKTFEFDIVKTDDQNRLINGAEFKIYDAVTGGNEVAVVKMDNGVDYRRARADETGVSIVVSGGRVHLIGFDNGTYYLEETVTPDGYNQLSGRQRFDISDDNKNAIFNENNNGDPIYSTGSGVQVINKTGTMLPETGGMGTTLFYALGGILVIGAGVALVTKKRMG